MSDKYRRKANQARTVRRQERREFNKIHSKLREEIRKERAQNKKLRMENEFRLSLQRRPTKEGWARRKLRFLIMRDGDKCAYCEHPISVRPDEGYKCGTVDHVWPLSKGGTNDLSNLVAACYECNQSKADQTPADFMRIIWGDNLEKCPHQLA